jgi:hypothetical protein
LCARLPDAGAEEIYGQDPNIFAAQFGRPMRAEPAEGGYRITGRAPFVSNCYDANWPRDRPEVIISVHGSGRGLAKFGVEPTKTSNRAHGRGLIRSREFSYALAAPICAIFSTDASR